MLCNRGSPVNSIFASDERSNSKGPSEASIVGNGESSCGVMKAPTGEEGSESAHPQGELMVETLVSEDEAEV